MSEVLEKEGIRNPPETITGSLQFLGPGLILSAAIVGSGELIATTNLGARAGFSLLWIIIFGCLLKVTIQLEYGRHCILHGNSTFTAWNGMEGFRIGKLHWTLIVGFLFMVSIFFGQAGVLGSAAQVANYGVPSVPLNYWLVLLVIVIGLLLSFGRYKFIETAATVLNVLFIFTLIYCVFSIQSTDYAFSFSDLAGGLNFHIPVGDREMMTAALAAFGITGVSSGEIIMYPYWCIEKGYAAWTGPNDGSEEWRRRAKGWIRVMTVDAILAMVVYTLSTIAFYILGAAVLKRQAALVDGDGLILQISQIFTEVLGDGSRVIFMLGAFAVLFSTVFSNVASFSRLWTDYFGQCGWLDYKDTVQRRMSVIFMTWVLALAWGFIYLLSQQPLLLVIIMGISSSAFLLVVGYQGVMFRYRHTEEAMRPSKFYDICLWLSLLSILYVAVRSLWGEISKMI